VFVVLAKGIKKKNEKRGEGRGEREERREFMSAGSHTQSS